MKLLNTIFILILLSTASLAMTSEVISFSKDKVSGAGPLPYNYRIIDGHINVGGHPLNPANSLKNSDEQVLATLKYLKSKDISTVIDLDASRSVYWRYKRLLRQAGFELFHVPMNENKVPNKEEWSEIREALKDPVYIHCRWGADRTGAVIARYLVESRSYTPQEAYNAVITGGTHAGPFGGLKADKYPKLVKFFWPDYSPAAASSKK